MYFGSGGVWKNNPDDLIRVILANDVISASVCSLFLTESLQYKLEMIGL